MIGSNAGYQAFLDTARAPQLGATDVVVHTTTKYAYPPSYAAGELRLPGSTFRSIDAVNVVSLFQALVCRRRHPFGLMQSVTMYES